jgi:hypothetical protein
MNYGESAENNCGMYESICKSEWKFAGGIRGHLNVAKEKIQLSTQSRKCGKKPAKF